MPWYYALIIAGAVVGPFEALYQFIRLQKRRDALKKGKAKKEDENHGPRP